MINEWGGTQNLGGANIDISVECVCNLVYGPNFAVGCTANNKHDQFGTIGCTRRSLITTQSIRLVHTDWLNLTYRSASIACLFRPCGFCCAKRDTTERNTALTRRMTVSAVFRGLHVWLSGKCKLFGIQCICQMCLSCVYDESVHPSDPYSCDLHPSPSWWQARNETVHTVFPRPCSSFVFSFSKTTTSLVYAHESIWRQSVADCWSHLVTRPWVLRVLIVSSCRLQKCHLLSR